MEDHARVVPGPQLLETDLTDEALLDALGDQLPRLQRMARVLAGADGDDLIAEAITRTLPRWRAGHVDHPVAYVRRTVVNLASRRWRRRRLAARKDRVALEWLPVATDTAEVVVERDRTLSAVMNLPPRRRAVVVMRFYDDMTLAQIADALGISEGTVKSQLSRALGQLRGDLGDQE